MLTIRLLSRAVLSKLVLIPFLSKSLRQFLFSRILFIAFLTFAGVLLTTTFLYENLLADQARKTARGIAAQTFAAIDNLMEHGPSREELWDFIAVLKNSHADTPYKIEMYRSELVDELFGPAEQPVLAGDILAVLESGRDFSDENGASNRYLYPLRADERCLSCHPNAARNAVLGVLEIRQNIAALSSRMRLQYLGLFILFGATILGLVLSVTVFITRKVTRTVDLFGKKTADINSIAELAAMEKTPAAEFSFAELNRAFSAVSALAKRLRSVAVDKDILEFEIKLLSKFIITSNVVQDWRQFVKELLTDINSVIDTYALLAFFQEDDNNYELDIFWRSPPSLAHRQQMETVVQEKLYRRLRLASDSPAVKIVHHDSGSQVPLPRQLSRRDIELRTKSLFLDAPKVGGIVGIGVQSDMAVDPVYHIVLDSVLTTLLNLVGSVKAISKYTKELEYYATRDPLTLLHNQRMFWELLEYEVHRADRHGYSFVILMIDLDNFKTVNDQYGHAFGDFFLQQLAATLRSTMRDGDMVARYGGDEFTVLLPETNQEEGMAAASRISEAVAALRVTTREGLGIRATTSIGLAVFPDHGRTAKDLFLVADNMMYKVKGQGKDAIALPDPEEITEIFRKESRLDFRVYQALEQKTVVPFFQPILDLGSGRILAHELLMRIPNEDGSMLPAGAFIKAAERTGLLSRLDQLLLEKACQAMHDQGYQGKLFINVSPKSFVAPKYFSFFHELLQRYGISPDRIVIEVTERDTVKNVTMLRKFLVKMKEAGYLFAIDDFGSGYSSFKYLKLFPIDYIKIEGEFIRNLLIDKDFLAYTKSIVTLAKELQVRTIAEYVEDEDIMRKAREVGIDFGQGYHIGRPSALFMETIQG